MANSNLTPNIITREALRILHAELNFIGKMDRQYDNRFAQSGAKIGQSLDIRLPNKYVTRDGAQLAVQNSIDRKVTLPVATQKGVDVSFSSVELTMDIDSFSDKFLKPAMAQLASSIEADAFNMYKSVPNFTGTVGSQVTYKSFQQSGQFLSENLAPRTDRCFTMNPASIVEFNDAVKGLFQSSDNIKKQYREGMMGRTGGFEVFENTIVPTHLTGTHGGTPLTDGASQGITGAGNAFSATTSLTTDGWTSGAVTLNEGDIITIADVFEVHAETKVSTGRLKRFAITAQVSDTTGDITAVITPAIIAGGAYQNASNLAADGKAIVVLGTTNTAYGQNLAFQKEAFTFVTADLEDVTQFNTWGAREVYDGISMRIARQYDINNDVIPCRIDVLYGFVATYPELACRLVHQLV